MQSYLIVKTGKSGAKLSDLYDSKIVAEGREIDLCRNRLVGSWYQSITTAAKQMGIKGTLSVLIHNPEDADVLLKDNQRTFIALAKGLNWKVVARIDADEADLSNASKSGRNETWKELVDNGTIIITKGSLGGRFTYNYAACLSEDYESSSYHGKRAVHKRAKKEVRDKVNLGGARGVAGLIKVLGTV
jgi:hypothetical protein